MAALAAMQRAHREAAQMLRALVERRRREVERRRDFGLGLLPSLMPPAFPQAKRETRAHAQAAAP